MSEQAWLFIAGTAVAVAAYFSKNFIFDQILEYRKVKGRVRNKLKYYANIISNADVNEDTLNEMWTNLRQLSCDLEEKYFATPFIVRVAPFRWFFGLPSRSQIDEAAAHLIGLSNGAGRRVQDIDHSEMAVAVIKGSLKIL